jgi:hypothetical protein
VDDSSIAADSWRFQNSIAQLRCGAVSGSVDVSHPELGLQSIAVGTDSLGGSILSVRRSNESGSPQPYQISSWPLADAYVRGRDLVASYAPADGWPFSPQIYWRINPSDAADELSSLSLLVSVQTHLLETWPRISIESRLHAAEALIVSTQVSDNAGTNVLSHGEHVFNPAASPGCIVFRFAGADFSYAEIIPPGDYRELRVSWSANGFCHTAWSLFADFLEKGVIWRARLQSLLLSRNNDVALARACCREIDQRPLPLTT